MQEEKYGKEQNYGFTVVPGSGQDSGVLQEKLRALPGVADAEVSDLQGRIWVQSRGIARSVLEQAITQSGYEVTGCTDESGRS